MLPRSRTLKALLLCAVLVFATLLAAEPIKKLKPTGYVDDFAHVIDPASRKAIEQLAAQIDHKTGAQIAVVTVRSLDGEDIESYASDLYKQWGIGPKSSNRGVLILLAVNDHRYRTEVGYGLEPILPDGKVGGFGREAVPFLRTARVWRGTAIDDATRRPGDRQRCSRHPHWCASTHAAAGNS